MRTLAGGIPSNFAAPRGCARAAALIALLGISRVAMAQAVLEMPTLDGVAPASQQRLAGDGALDPALQPDNPINLPETVGTRPVEPVQPPTYGGSWTWQMMPEGIIYHSYLAGTKEPRIASQWEYDKNQKGIWDIALGGRVGLIRYGSDNAQHPEGWELDMEGAAFPRLNLEESLDLMACDFRFGLPLTYGVGPWQTKFAFYHLSSHLGDEIMLKHPDVPRINYSRNCLAWGNSYYWTQNIRLYGEAAYAFYVDGGAKPWEFQFGIEYSPAAPTGVRPVPFFAVNGYLRQEVQYGGNVVIETGYQWRGVSNHLFRAGIHYYVGKSDEYEFFRQYEDKVGLGLWYDY